MELDYALTDLDALASRLADTTANLDTYIAERAEAIAAPKIAEIQSAAAARLAEQQIDYERRLERATDLVAELRRQLDIQLRLRKTKGEY